MTLFCFKLSWFITACKDVQSYYTKKGSEGEKNHCNGGCDAQRYKKRDKDECLISCGGNKWYYYFGGVDVSWNYTLKECKSFSDI